MVEMATLIDQHAALADQDITKVPALKELKAGSLAASKQEPEVWNETYGKQYTELFVAIQRARKKVDDLTAVVTSTTTAEPTDLTGSDGDIEAKVAQESRRFFLLRR
mmetsp:Transcript_106619/g.309025  ORF Transcript_106619/g.309025 Transcript_106619/m.309025 type:complete len:107 (-) Transcript_106619:1363-1683(-)